jgi:hypothetical protein
MLRRLIVLAGMLMMAHVWVADATSQVRQPRQSKDPPLKIEGAKVSTEDQAEKLATEAYFRKMGGKRGLQTAKVVSVNELEVDIKGFAQRGDRVWEVRIVGLRGLKSVIWVHAGTGQTLFLIPTER